MKIHDPSEEEIFQSKRYTIYECTLQFIICVTFSEFLSAIVKITRHHHHFPQLSMTFAIFYDFPGLENGLPKFHDFP